MYCKYKFPVEGLIKAEKLHALQVDDFVFEFSTIDGYLSGVSVTFPVPPPPSKPPNATFWIHEPRAAEVEEIILQIAANISVVSQSQIDIHFQKRKIEWVNEHGEPTTSLLMDFGTEQKERASMISFQMLMRSIIEACTHRKHNALLTFYKRGAADAIAHRYIEAFYNFYFLLEYLYIHGKTGKWDAINELKKSEEFVGLLNKVITEKKYESILSKEQTAMFSDMGTSGLIQHLVQTRGDLHHPNKNRKNYWNPDKQYRYAAEALVLYFVCSEIAIKQCLTNLLSEKINGVYKKIERCLRLDKPVRVITR